MSTYQDMYFIFLHHQGNMKLQGCFVFRNDYEHFIYINNMSHLTQVFHESRYLDSL